MRSGTVHPILHPIFVYEWIWIVKMLSGPRRTWTAAVNVPRSIPVLGTFSLRSWRALSGRFDENQERWRLGSWADHPVGILCWGDWNRLQTAQHGATVWRSVPGKCDAATARFSRSNLNLSSTVKPTSPGRCEMEPGTCIWPGQAVYPVTPHCYWPACRAWIPARRPVAVRCRLRD
jgi:hypothetical protein